MSPPTLSSTPNPLTVIPVGPVFGVRLEGLTPPGTYVLVVGKTGKLAMDAAEEVHAALTAPRPVTASRAAVPLPLPDASSSPAYTGSVCSVCQSVQVIRTGACETCQSCGSTSSCG